MVLAGLGAWRGVTLGLLALALAMPMRSSPALAQEMPFEVAGVAVDITAESGAVARDRAMIDGQRRALDILLLRLAPPEEVGRLPRLDDERIAEMVEDVAVDSERVSALRYAGSLTVRFRADLVRALLEGTGVRFAATASKPVLVLPILSAGGRSMLWDDGNAWREAWVRRQAGKELVPLLVPMGDLDDLAAIDAEQAVAGDTARLLPLTGRYGAGEALVAVAALGIDSASGQPTVIVTARRYGPEGMKDMFTETVIAAGETVDNLYARAAERVALRLQDAWKQQNLVTAGVEKTLTVRAPVASLAEWTELRRRLAGAASLRRHDVISLSRLEGRLSLVYVGDEMQLARALAQRDLALVQELDGWRLGLTGAMPSASAIPPTVTTP